MKSDPTSFLKTFLLMVLSFGLGFVVHGIIPPTPITQVVYDQMAKPKKTIVAVHLNPSLLFKVKLSDPKIDLDNDLTLTGFVTGPSEYGEFKCVTFDKDGVTMNSGYTNWTTTPNWFDHLRIDNPRYPTKVECWLEK